LLFYRIIVVKQVLLNIKMFNIIFAVAMEAVLTNSYDSWSMIQTLERVDGKPSRIETPAVFSENAAQLISLINPLCRFWCGVNIASCSLDRFSATAKLHNSIMPSTTL